MTPNVPAMLQQMHTVVSTAVNSNSLSIHEMEQLFTPATLKKGDFLALQGVTCTTVAFISSGMFRFFSTVDGDEKTHDFAFPDSFITAYTSLLEQKPSDMSIQALSTAQLLTISRKELYRLYDKHPTFERIGRIFAEQAFLNSRTHLLSILHDDAETRYQKLITRAPQIIQSIPLRYIASYLGISPETLSRIRRRISIS